MAKVAIIGAGPSGLVAAKSALECGLEPTVFERSSEVGGLWREDGFTWDSLCTNLAAETCAFSDFPYPKGTRANPLRQEVLEYLGRYADEFGLRSYVRFSCYVERIVRDEDRKCWRVTWRDGTQGEAPSSTTDSFTFVMVCSGVFSRPFYPRFLRDAVEKQSGSCDGVGSTPRILHTCRYRNPRQFVGQRVLVVGCSYSGADVVAEIARSGCAERIVNAVGRRPCWYLHRCSPRGIPVDLLQTSRCLSTAAATMSSEERRRAGHATFLQASGVNPGDVDPLLRVNPDTDLPFRSVTDAYLETVKDGLIELKPSLVGVEGSEAIFADGTRKEVDAILCATGFHYEIPFLDEDLLRHLEFDCEDQQLPVILYKSVFSPGLPNMAFVGANRRWRFVFAELEARWACLMFSGRVPTPSEEEFAEELAKQRALRDLHPRPQFVGKGIVENADELAQLCGVHPLRGELVFPEDKELQDWLVNGPLLPAHFRLRGPFAKPGLARDMIQDTNDRMSRLTNQKS